jgi:hypothetical protein
MPKTPLLTPAKARTKLSRIGERSNLTAELRAALAKADKKAVRKALAKLDSLQPDLPAAVEPLAAVAEPALEFRFAWVDPEIPVTVHLYVDGAMVANQTYRGGLQYFSVPCSAGRRVKIVFGATFWHGGWRYHLDLRRLSGTIVALGTGSDPDPSSPSDDAVTIMAEQEA